MYDVAKISEGAAEALAEKELPVFVDLDTKAFYTYEEVADSDLDPNEYDKVQIDEDVNDILWPVRKRRRMFPR